MPIWLQIAFGAVPGALGLIMAVFNMGSMKRALNDLVKRADGWDSKIADVQKDTSYIRGRLDGRQEGLDETADRATRRRSRAALKAVST